MYYLHTQYTPQKVAQVRYNPVQHYGVGWGTGGRHYSNTARFCHDAQPSAATPSGELRNN